MAVQRSASADKIIVDRTNPRRNSEVARAIRRTRDRLAEQVGAPAFDRELLKLHAHAMINTVVAMPLLVILIAASGLALGMDTELLVWAPITMLGYAVLALVARRVERLNPADLDTLKWSRLFLLAHAASGVGWIYFVWVQCAS